MHLIPVKIDMTVGRLDQRSMSLEIRINGKSKYSWDQIDQDKLLLEFSVDPMSTIEFITAGKDIFDTKVDENGNLLQDKFIKVDRLCIANMPVDKWMLEKSCFKCLDQTGNAMPISNYFGQNGNWFIQIGSTPMRFFLDLLANSS